MFIDARTFTDAAADGKLTHKTFCGKVYFELSASFTS